MSADIVKFQISGTPKTLMENAAEIADDMKFALMVFVDKDGKIHSKWSHLPSNLEGLGAIEMLRAALMEQS